MKKVILITVLSLGFTVFSKGQTKITFYTSMGNFDAAMYDSLMPITAGNFISLVDSGFYDGVIFHRIIKNFVIQGGDPTGTGTGGPGYTIPDEFDTTGTLSNTIRTLSMANSGPNSGGSQFFINLKNNTFLDYDKAPLTSAHPVFGIVRDGWHIVDSISNVAVNGNDRPITPVVMDSVRITGRYISTKEYGVAKNRVSIAPNPFQSEVRLEEAMPSQLEAIKVYTTKGTLVKEIINPATTTMDLSELNPGVYMIHLSYKDGRQGVVRGIKAE